VNQQAAIDTRLKRPDAYEETEWLEQQIAEFQAG